MKYIDDMMDKYGFNDGASTPQEVGELRMVYVAVINALAIHAKSDFRIVAYDRPGMHNGCMVLFVNIAELKSKVPDRTSRWEIITGRKPATAAMECVELHLTDDAFRAAYDEADNMDPPLEELVDISVTVDEDELQATLSSIRKGELTCGNH